VPAKDGHRDQFCQSAHDLNDLFARQRLGAASDGPTARWINRKELAQLSREPFVLEECGRFDRRRATFRALSRINNPHKRGKPLICDVRDQEAPVTFIVKLDCDGFGAKT
jgi:hypothetical protein